MSSHETMIIEGVNCRRTRSIYYGMAITSSLGGLTATLLQLWLLPPSWEDKNRVKGLFLYAATFLVYAILVVRSLCLPIPTITTDTYRMGGEKWWRFTFCSMVVMFFQTYHLHSMECSIYAFGVIAGFMPIKQLSWPAQDVYIQDVLFTDFLCCLSCFLGYHQPTWLVAFFLVFVTLALLSYFITHKLNRTLPLYSKVN